jgi:hypothetical protein
MQECRPSPRIVPAVGDEHFASLRQLGARAHQLRAATRAADYFNAQDSREDRNTGCWLMSSALAMASELASDVDGLARSLKNAPTDTTQQLKVASIRVRAHQLHAAARAADHFLEQEAQEDRETGSWLIATAYGLAQKLAAEIDDSVVPMRRPLLDKATIEPHDAGFVRRVAEATAPLR